MRTEGGIGTAREGGVCVCVCVCVYLLVVRTERRVCGGGFGTLPAHEVAHQLLHRLQSLPLTGVRLHKTAWGGGERK